jgi:NodT family efflux transporter outer membrane factor (OMF) lipoprotein
MQLHLLFLLTLLGITGCVVGPDYQKPALTTPEHWLVEAASSQTSLNVDSQNLTNWWQSFGDAQLNTLMEWALAENLTVKIAQTHINAARAARSGAFSALFPSVNLGTGAQRVQNPYPGLAPGIHYNLYEMGFDALWEVDLFGGLQRRLEAAGAELESETEQYQQVLVSLCAEVARSYIDYRSLHYQLHITQSNLLSQQQTLRLMEKLNTAGVGTRHDVIRARALSQTTEAQLPVLEAKLQAALRQLDVLVGGQPGTVRLQVDKAAATPSAPGLAIMTTPTETLRQRPDIRVAERGLAAATAMQGAAVAELYPKLSLSAFLGLRNTDVESLFKSTAFSYGAAAGLLQPVLNLGRIRAGINQADAKQQAAFLSYETVVLTALQETETAMSIYLKAQIRRRMLATAAADLGESVRLSQLRYQEGVISFLDVLDAQRILYAAEIELARSEAEASTDLIAVYKALGGGANRLAPSPQLSTKESW